MRILILSRPDGKAKPGGDLGQIDETARWLGGAGHAVDLRPALPEKLEGYDVAMVFNLQRGAEALARLEGLAEAGIPTALTPIHHSLHAYREGGLRGLRRFVRALAGDGALERVQRMGRALAEGRSFGDSLGAARTDEADRRRRALGLASALLLCCDGEGRALEGDHPDVRLPPRHVVPLAIPEGDDPPPAPSTAREGFLWAGRIEDLKNPLAALAVAADLPAPLELAGAKNPRQPDHGWLFDRALARTPRARWLGPLPRAELLARMRRCRVHLHTSWSDTIGRVNLEAAWAGAALVVSPHCYAAEVLGDGIVVADGARPAELLDGARRAWEHGPPDGLGERIRDGHGWSTVGPRLEAALMEIVERG